MAVRTSISSRKEGGNTFSSTNYFGYTTGGWQSNNLGDLLSRGLSQPDATDYVYFANVAGGGPIKRNALWFYASYQDNGNQNIVANSFYRDGTPGMFDQRLTNRSARLTWQATPKNKISGLVDDNDKMIDHEGHLRLRQPVKPRMAGFRDGSASSPSSGPRR